MTATIKKYLPFILVLRPNISNGAAARILNRINRRELAKTYNNLGEGFWYA